MTLIIGGKSQGKLTYAEQLFDNAYTSADCNSCEPENAMTAGLIIDYHELIRKLGDKAEEFTSEFCEKNPGAVITLAEVGSGIIPVSQEEREYREAVGRCGCILAARSEKVVRMFCGIAIDIK